MWGDPIYIAREEKGEMEEKRRMLEEILIGLTEKVDRLCGEISTTF